MSDTIRSRSDWVFSQCGGSNILEDKKRLYQQYIQYMLIRTQSMFKYSGLPDTIPEKDLELILQVTGSVTITKVNGKLYAFYGGLGGELNEYYLPTISTVSNPYLNYSKNLEINKDCIVILNDPLYVGLMPLFEKNASLMAETDISLRFSSINSRIQELIIADNDVAKESAKAYLDDIVSGSKIGIIASNGFFDGIKTADYSSRSSNTIKDLIELHNYIKSSWYLDLGLSANWNAKRESINESEASMNDDTLLPLIDQMLEQRKMGVDRVNKMYGTNISVDLESSWKKIREEIEIQTDQAKEENDPKENTDEKDGDVNEDQGNE